MKALEQTAPRPRPPPRQPPRTVVRSLPKMQDGRKAVLLFWRQILKYDMSVLKCPFCANACIHDCTYNYVFATFTISKKNRNPIKMKRVSNTFLTLNQVFNLQRSAKCHESFKLNFEIIKDDTSLPVYLE